MWHEETVHEIQMGGQKNWLRSSKNFLIGVLKGENETVIERIFEYIITFFRTDASQNLEIGEISCKVSKKAFFT